MLIHHIKTDAYLATQAITNARISLEPTMPLPEKILQGARRDYPIERLLEDMADPRIPEERRLLGLVLPPWQRPEVWGVEQKRRFIEGIFLGFGCGYYVTNGLEWLKDGTSAPMSGWLLDGQQRISALRDFLEDRLVLFGDVRISCLSAPEVRRFRHEVFPCFELEYTDDENKLKELYDRLNFSGIAHTLDQRVQPTTQGA